ncbi:hypothetical protein DMA12_34820 [Amycolatopsis balhimycina DSM 5908]|uniref:Uncharacterized protein n=1 Tax=Amycolatopsis balhimycina DSM 5908 TaxID=1081091 RepID=A0A428W4B0_AMYBA|nr:hypothetical protein DMA12_34820 [Amycolatopsis balhimycina DSM 5908]
MGALWLAGVGGNGAFGRLVVQRDSLLSSPAPSGPAPLSSPAPSPEALVCRPEEARMNSSNVEVDGRSVADVGADLQIRNRNYRRLVDFEREGAQSTQRDEQNWYTNLGVTGSVIDWFNSEHETDPTRWARVYPMWDRAASGFDAAISGQVTTAGINDTGQASVDARATFEEAAQLTSQYRDEYQRYLTGFSHSAEGILRVSTIVRDVSFATAVALAVVVAAPVVAGALTTFGTGTLGLSAGSTALTAFTYGGTAVGMGALGAGIEGTGQALGTLGAQASAAVVDLIRGSEHAADNFDFGQVAEQGWEGMRRGFVDGVLAFAGAQAERVAASYASQAVRAALGPANSSLMSLIIRRALTRAISGGATGSVIGALQAGLNAAIQGQDMNGIMTAMERGFVVGAAAGTTLGAIGGGFEARGADRLRQAILPRLRAAAANGSPNAQLLFDQLQGELAANPGIGTNDQLRRALPGAWRAVRDPDAIANALADIWLEEHLLGLMAPRDAASRYGQAAMVLSRRAGAPVVVLPRGTSFSPDAFYNDVVLRGNRFLDLSVLDISPEHGATTHMIQDLVVDRALHGTGMRSEQLRALFSGATDSSGRNIGNDLWIEIFDSIQNGLNQPEVVYPIMRDGLNGLQ